MTKQWIVLIVGAVVIVAGAVVLFGDGEYGARTTNENNEATTQDTVSEAEVPESGSGSLLELIRLGSNLACDFSYVDPESGADMDGTMYIAERGERFRGDFTVMQDGQTFETHIIRAGTKGYTWSQTPAGSMAVSFEIAEEESIFDAQEDAPVNYNQQFDYSCDRWRVDASLFVPPSDIEFMDMTNMMMDMQNNSETDARAMQCAACDGIADESQKAQCKAALGC